MSAFMDDRFLLHTEIAADLYTRFAEDLPIIDYHCHLPPDLMARDHRFRSITELWLDGDHYKWRAMRSNGVEERYCTGNASDWEKFEAWARTVPDTLRNPLFHWTHMELRKPFGVTALLNPSTAREIYDDCNAHLATPGFTAMGLLERFRVAVVCTTDDPVDALDHHATLARRDHPCTQVYPTWRPDKVFAVDDSGAFNRWVDLLEARVGRSIGDVATLLSALEDRHTAFHTSGCRASDHGLPYMFSTSYTLADAARAFDAVRAGRTLSADAVLTLRSALLRELALFDHARGWVQQFHLGPIRNNNTRMRKTVGPDTGFDSMGDFEQALPLARFLDSLDETEQLAKTILYNLNPRDNAVFATMIGNFQGGGVPGKMQYGSAWWFLDQLDGMRQQIDVLSNMGLLARFVGMLTDSRSFLSYSRHEYFRRLLCQMLGEDVRRGYLPDDRVLLGRLVENVCFFNARDYFGFTLGRAADGALRRAV